MNKWLITLDYATRKPQSERTIMRETIEAPAASYAAALVIAHNRVKLNEEHRDFVVDKIEIVRL